MAAPRNAFLVYLKAGGPPVLVLGEADAKSYPGRAGSSEIVVIRGDAVDTFYQLAPSHPFPESPPLVFDRAAADARKALRASARLKLTAEEQAACGLGTVEG